VDYYPQPRPVMYGTSDTEAAVQTQTAPVRTGPPRYPPAPPLAGEAPDPFNRPRPTFAPGVDMRTVPPGILSVLYAVASAFSLFQVVLGKTAFDNPAVGEIVLLGEVVIGIAVIACLRWLGGREYLLAWGLVILHVLVGMALAQWQSPALWVACALLLYLMRPSVRRRYMRMGQSEIRDDLARYRSGHPRRARRTPHHPFQQISRSEPQYWHIRW
jgi:hypothetical protein